MGRLKKQGLDWFPVDVSFDEKVEAIELLHGNNGLVWVIKFWQTAYTSSDGSVDFSSIFSELHASRCRISVDTHHAILDTALKVGFCYECIDGSSIYTSDGIQRRFAAVSLDRRCAISRKNKNTTNNNNNIITSVIDKTIEESRVEESRVEDISVVHPNNDRTITEQTPNPDNSSPEQLPNNPSNVAETTPDTTKTSTTPLWKENSERGFAEYLKISDPEWVKMYNDWEWIAMMREHFPGVVVRKTLQAMWDLYWGTKAGWQNKRSKRTTTIDWRSTIQNTFKSNRVFLQKNEHDTEADQLRRMGLLK